MTNRIALTNGTLITPFREMIVSAAGMGYGKYELDGLEVIVKADILVFDTNIDIKMTIVDGKILYESFS